MDRMQLRYVDKPIANQKTIEEYKSEIEHYKSLYARTKQDGILELINNLETDLLNLQIEQRPDEYKKYKSRLLGITMNLNMTKKEIICSDGAYYTFDEILNRPFGLSEEKITTIHKIKLFGCQKVAEYEEMEQAQ